MKIRLTEAQYSALDCRGVRFDPEPRAALIASCWLDRDLIFEEGDRGELFAAITEEANAEDDAARESSSEPAERKFARGACTALTNLASKVLDADPDEDRGTK